MIVRNFEYLLALSRERHFARAAAACSVSQPTLSAGIKQLEEDMDVLIVRRGQRFEGLTPEGERVLAWAQQMLEDCNRLKQELHDLRDQGMRGPFRIGMLPGISGLASLLSVAFAERYPDLQISVATGTADELLARVRQGDLEVALTYVDEAAGEGLETHLLYRERMFLFTTAELAESRRVTWADVATLPLCLLRGAVPRATETRLAASRISASRLMETDSAAVLAAHVGTGRWSTVLPQSLAALLAGAPNLRALAIARPGEQANVGFVTVKCTPLPPAVHALMELAHQPEAVASIRAMLAAHEPLLTPEPATV